MSNTTVLPFCGFVVLFAVLPFLSLCCSPSFSGVVLLWFVMLFGFLSVCCFSFRGLFLPFVLFYFRRVVFPFAVFFFLLCCSTFVALFFLSRSFPSFCGVLLSSRCFSVRDFFFSVSSCCFPTFRCVVFLFVVLFFLCCSLFVPYLPVNSRLLCVITVHDTSIAHCCNVIFIL
jgi:hypothetical protein